jgi:hypothetical protein
MKLEKTGRHLKLVTKADWAFYEGPITRMDLWHRYQPVNYKKIIAVFLGQAVLLRSLIFWGFHR